MIGISAREAALTSAYHDHVQDIRAFIRRRTRLKPEDVDDLVHDVFLTAWKLRDRVYEPGGIRYWLFAITHHIVLHAQTKTRRTVSKDPAWLALTANNHRDAWEVLDDLTGSNRPRTRRLLFMRYAATLSIPEIASIVKTSQPAVRKRLQRAREEIQGFLKPGA